MILYIILAAATFFAAIIQGASGMAFGMILLGILPHFLEYGQAVGIVSLMATILVGINAWSYRKSVDWSILPVPMTGYVIFTWIGIQILSQTAAFSSWNKFLGILLMIWAIYMLFGKQQIVIRPTLLNGMLWGSLGGLLGGLFGNATIMVFYFLSVTNDKEIYMGSMQMFFFIAILFDILFRSQSGMITVVTLQMAAFAIVFALAGFLIGRKILKRMNFAQLQKLVYGIVFICGLLLLC